MLSFFDGFSNIQTMLDIHMSDILSFIDLKYYMCYVCVQNVCTSMCLWVYKDICMLIIHLASFEIKLSLHYCPYII